MQDTQAAENLRKIWHEKRKSLGLTQENAALALDMGQSAFSQYLHGRVALSVEAVLKFAHLLKVNPRQIRDDLPVWATPGDSLSSEVLEFARSYESLGEVEKRIIAGALRASLQKNDATH